MNEKGYISLAAVGTIILLLSASFVTYFEWNRHRSKKEAINRQGNSQLSFDLTSEKSELNGHVERALTSSLWRVGKSEKGPKTDGSEVERIEDLAENELQNDLQQLSHRKNLFLPSDGRGVDFEVSRGEDNGTIANVEFSEGVSIEGSTPDGSTRIEIPIESVRETTSPRFFVLQEKMDEFEEDLNSVERRWKYFEYALAYSQAWLEKDLDFSKKRTETLFRLALATHEIDKFGSSDYRSLLQEVAGSKVMELMGASDMELDQFGDPLGTPSVRKFSEKTEKSLKLLEYSKKSLNQAKLSIDNLKNFNPEKRLDEQSRKISNLSDNYSRSKDDFSEICGDTKSIYAFPRKSLNGPLRKVRESKQALKKSREQFKKGLEAIESSKENNPFLKSFYEDITQAKPRGVYPQINCGFESVLENMEDLERKIIDLKEQFTNINKYETNFPADYREKLSKDTSENEIEELFSKAQEDADESFSKYVDDYEKKRNKVEKLHSSVSKEVESQTNNKEPNWSDTYTEYPRLGEDGDPEDKRVEQYVISENQGSIWGLETVLKRTKSQLGRIENLNDDFSKEKGELEKFGLDKCLKNVLRSDEELSENSELSRNEKYELSPPVPLENNPNISVYHDLDIESVRIKRLDPIGLVNRSGPPTPIYIWQIRTTIFWGLWDVKIEIDKPLEEEIFDYPNQAIPRPISENSNQYVHKPLPYERHFGKSEYNFKLLILSLRNFDISY